MSVIFETYYSISFRNINTLLFFFLISQLYQYLHNFRKNEETDKSFIGKRSMLHIEEEQENCCSNNLNLDNIFESVPISKVPMGNLLSANELQVKMLFHHSSQLNFIDESDRSSLIYLLLRLFICCQVTF